MQAEQGTVDTYRIRIEVRKGVESEESKPQITSLFDAVVTEAHTPETGSLGMPGINVSTGTLGSTAGHPLTVPEEQHR